MKNSVANASISWRVSLSSVVFLAVTCLLLLAWLIDKSTHPYRESGPTSRDGVRVEVDVHDVGVGIDPSYWADVEIIAKDGLVVYRWVDPSGQKSGDGVRTLVSSMRWSDGDALEFVYRGDFGEKKRVSIVRSPDGEWSCRSDE